MFYSYNSKEFGNKLKELRLSLRLSQAVVSKTLDISVDGLRKIENGYVTPRFETLVKLSAIYKRNLISLMEKYSKVPDLLEFYNSAQLLINNVDPQGMTNLKNQVLSIKNELTSNKLILHEEYNQLLLFLDSSVLFLANTEKCLIEAKSIIHHALSLTIHDFDSDKFQTYNYNIFEIRLLHLLALTERRLDNPNTTIKLLEFLIDKITSDNDNNDSLKNTNFLYFSLSYSYHEIKDYDMSLLYANMGIDFSVQNNRYNELHLLYYRKGIAEYLLGFETYLGSLRTSIFLLDLMKSPLADEYRRITLKNYGLSI